MTSRRAVAILLLAFAALAVVYNASTPVFESPDELQHMAFVAWLADGRSLPVLDPAHPGPWYQEGAGPPLYYWLVARLVGGVPHPPPEQLATANPYANVGNPLRPGNKNVVLHDPQQESWPYRGGTLFVHLSRALSTLMALGTLLAIHRMGRSLLPGRPGIALAMTGLVAFTPQFLFLSASVNNDNLVILISSWTLALLASWLCADGLPSVVHLGALGLLLGLAALSKASGLLLWPLAAGSLVWLAWRARRLRWLLIAGSMVFLVAAALSGWWFVRNVRLYGDITGISPHLQIMGRRQSLPANVKDALAEFRGLRYSFWLLFGWFSILAPEPFYWVMDGLTALGLIGYGIFLVRLLRHHPRSTQAAHLMLVGWFGLVAIGVIRWTLLTPASQGRLLYPALAPLALFVVVGWAEWMPQRLHRLVGSTALVVWGLWAALCPILFLKPAYALPQRAQSLDELSPLPSPMEVRFGDCCELVGAIWPDNGQLSSQGTLRSGPTLDQPIHAGDQVPLTLIWRALNKPDRDYTVFVHATTPDGKSIGEVDTYPGNGMYPTSLWRPGEFIVDIVQVPITWTAEGPALVSFEVGVYNPDTESRLPATAPDGVALERVTAGEAGLVPSPWPTVPPHPQADTLFGGKIRLTNVDLSTTVIRSGDVVTVTLQWEALERITQDYTGFVHLVDAVGKDIAQDDHLPLQGWYPTRVWSPGTVIDDPYRLQLSPDLPEGVYELWGGVYQLEADARLPAIARRAGEDGILQPTERWKDDLVHLGTLTVTRASE